MSADTGGRGQGGPRLSGRRYLVGIPPYLHSRPLVYNLDNSPHIDLVRAVPSRLKTMLATGELDATLLPTSALPSFGSRLTILQAGCLAACGSTLIARIFSQVNSEELNVLWVDSGSQSVTALAQVLWRNLYHRQISVIPFDATFDRAPHDAQAVLLIGDRSVTEPPLGFDRQFDPMAMWYEMTGLPFVFSIWATMCDSECGPLFDMLLEARQKGQQNLEKIATEYGPACGWPVDLAVRSLTQELQFEFTDAHREGMEEFLELAAEHKLIDSASSLHYHLV
jgi:predicted solute-binding protein